MPRRRIASLALSAALLLVVAGASLVSMFAATTANAPSASATPMSEDFSTRSTGTISSPSTLGDFTYSTNSPQDTTIYVGNTNDLGVTVDGNAIAFLPAYDGAALTHKIVSTSGKFRLESIDLASNVSAGSATLYGYRSGNQVASTTFTDSPSITSLSFTDAAWNGIDELRFTGTDLTLIIDRIIVSEAGPRVVAVTTRNLNGTKTAGQTVTVVVRFDAIVNVTGTPELMMETGTTDRAAVYSSGSGTAYLDFTYTVQTGDNNPDLDYTSVTALSNTGGTITNGVGDTSSMTLPTPGSLSSISGSKNIVVDALAPSVSSVSATNPNASYGVGRNLTIRLSFTEAVTVTGTPTITLETGTTDEVANYATGSGTSTIDFVYTVAAGDTSSLLDYTSTTALILNDGTISDAAGNAATLTLATPGTVGSLSYSKSLVIETVRPTVTNVTSTKTNGTWVETSGISIQVTFSEAVNVIGGPRLTMETGSFDHLAIYNNGTGTSTLNFQYTVGPNESSSDLDYTSTTALILNGGAINDLAGNAATLTLPAPGTVGSLGYNKDLVIDAVPPRVSSVSTSATNGTYGVGATIPILITMTEIVTVTIGTPQITLETGTSDAVVNYTSGSGTTVLRFDYTVRSGDVAADLDYVATNSFALNGGVVKDSANNWATRTLASPSATNSLGANADIVIDGTAPTVSSVTRVDSATVAGPSTSWTVTFSEGVSGVSADDFTLTTTGTASASISSVTSTSSTTYTVVAGSMSGNGTMRLDVNSSGTGIADAASNALSGGFTSGEVYTVAVPVVPEVPGPVSALAGDGRVTIAFAAPSNGGADITSYTVRVVELALDVNVITSPAIVTGLTNGTSYSFTVAATNSVGTGSASSPIAATPMAEQTISFSDPGDQGLGTTPTLLASTSAPGLTVRFSSSTTSVCEITTGGELTPKTLGSCTIAADQDGDSSTLAATTVSWTFQVVAVVPGAPTITDVTAGDGEATITFTAPTFDGGSTITGYSITTNPAGTTTAASGSPFTITGLTNGEAVSFTVTATNSVGTSGTSSPSNGVVPKAAQMLVFANPGSQDFGTTPTLSASIDSPLAVTFTSSTTSVCEITSGGLLTFHTIGWCTIDAAQSGGRAYLAATTQQQTFEVVAVVPGMPTITSVTAGDAEATVTFTAPTFDGGSAITGYTVTSDPDSVTASGTSSPIVVHGLRNGIAHTFTVTATNTAGDKVGSPSSSVTPASAPTVIAVSATTANGTHGTGAVISLTITFDSTVIVDTTGGTPELVLETGTTDHSATYTSGSGTTELTFTYTVLAGDMASDLDYVDTSALRLEGATIANSNGTAAVLTLPSPGAAGSLGDSRDLVVDSTPTTTSTSTTSTSTTSTTIAPATTTTTVPSTATTIDVSTPIVESPETTSTTRLAVMASTTSSTSSSTTSSSTTTTVMSTSNESASGPGSTSGDGGGEDGPNLVVTVGILLGGAAVVGGGAAGFTLLRPGR